MKREQGERIGPVDFLEREVLPALFERLDAAFPEFGWERKGRGWTATNRAHTKESLGVRPGRVVCNAPFGFLVHGGEPTSWTAYVSGGAAPRGRDFVEAVRKLADLAGVDASPLDRPLSPEEEARVHEREARAARLEKHAARMAEFFMEPSLGFGARSFLETRGFKWDDFQALVDLGFGVCKSGGPPADEAEGLEEYELEADPRWIDRLVIPLRDPWGNLRGLAGRALKDGAEPKYLYLEGTRKEDFVAFGLDVALRSKEGREDLVLVEGVLDPFLLQARGLPNVAAIGGSGKELSASRWEALARLGVRSVTLALDHDEAGLSGTLAAVENASKGRNVPKVYVLDPRSLGDAKDPAELVASRGLEAFRGLLEKRRAAAVYAGEVLLQDVTPESPDPKRREAVALVLGLVEKLRGAEAGLDREDLLRLAVERTGYSFEALEEQAEALASLRRREERERDLDEILEEARTARTEKKGTALEVARTTAERLASLQAQAVEPPPPFSVERLDRESSETRPGKGSGWRALDELEARFHEGELSVLGGRTGHGKTSALVGLLVNFLLAAERARTDELFVFYSAEELEVRVYHRLLAVLTAKEGAGWDSNEARDFLRDRASSAYWPNPNTLEAAKTRLRSLESRLLVVHRPAWTVDEIAAHALDLSKERAVGAVLVDYLQRVPPPARGDRRDIEVSAVARRLHHLAGEVSAPVVAAAQINRDAVPDKYREKLSKAKDYTEAGDVIRTARPELYHLREGGSEQEADLVLGFLNYAADFRENENTGRVPDVTRFEIGTLKTRYGTPGRWTALAFEGRYGLLRDPGTRDEV